MQGVVVPVRSGGIDVLSVDPQSRRTKKVQPLGLCVVGDLDHMDGVVDAEVEKQPLQVGQELLVARAAVDAEHLDQRLLPGALSDAGLTERSDRRGGRCGRAASRPAAPRVAVLSPTNPSGVSITGSFVRVST